mmetsp:Transcript_8896/g.7883  ORF Transcript_8896/g.7883 Transcript_8896/m.7883 type:complete len:204 (+) Transcript_8896:289-900(+)
MFKTACLNYEPTAFKYRDRVFSYEDIHEMKENIIDKCTDVLTKDNVFKTLELHPKRMYDDHILSINEKKRLEGDKIYKLNVSTSALNSRSKLTEQQKRGLINKFLTSQTPQNKRFQSITDQSSDGDGELITRMPRLGNTKETTGTHAYLFNTDDTRTLSKRFTDTRTKYSKSQVNKSDLGVYQHRDSLMRPQSKFIKKINFHS